MKVYNPIGSKERFLEMFQRVNKISLNEDILSGNVIENAFNALKNNELNIKQTNNQANGNQNIIEIVATDRENDEITFRFRLSGSENDQEGVVSVDNAELIGFEFNSRAYQMEIPEGMSSLTNFNRKYANEIASVVGDFADFDTSQASDELYEEAVSLIDNINISETNQEFEDDVDTKWADDDYTRNVEPEDPLAMPPDYTSMDNPFGDDTEEEPEAEENPEEQALFTQAFDNLMARNKTPRNPNYYPTRPEIDKEMLRLKPQPQPKKEKPRGVGNMMAVGKKRVYPAFADKYLSEENPTGVVTNSFKNLLSPEKKSEIIRKAKEVVDKRLGNRINQIPREQYLQLLQQTALFIYHHGLHDGDTHVFGVEDLNETDYPKDLEIGKEFSTSSKYPKPKKHRVKKTKIKTTVDEGDEQMSHQPFDDESEDDGMSFEPQGDEVAQLAQDKEENGEILKGGKGDGASPLEFDPDQIIKGMEVESEHTNDPMIAIEIVLDHLSEDPEYYTRKDDPEASAQFGASNDTETDTVNPDDETTDVLLGYKSKNVGDSINELNTSTYANVMNKTSNYPWKNDDKTRNKMGNVNKLTKERFEQEFYNEFPKETTRISTNLGEYVFVGIKYDTNYNKYWLIFVKKHGLGMDDYLWIKDDNGQIYIDNNINKGVEIDNNSKNLINQMLKYDVNRLNKSVVGETMIGAANATSAVGGSDNNTDTTDEIGKYQEYKSKDINTLSDSEKKEYFDLWTKYENKTN